MPKRTDIKRVLVIGSGPIVIGQACEFDYSGTQACKALRDEGLEVVLVNSNPATIMTDPELADRTYVEPLTPEVLEAIIEREKPDAILPTVGGQTALNLAVALGENGTLEKYGVELIGASVPAIKIAEDRLLFRDAMRSIGADVPESRYVKSIEEALGVVEELGFPSIIRPSFTLGGVGAGIAYNIEEFRELAGRGLDFSPVHEVLLEESVIGWKEFELEVMRDGADNFVVICSIENVDPMGVHTGDSITVAPALTLTDKEYQRMRDLARRIIRKVGVETGGSNIQFAINPADGRIIVIEMNPRVSRSSALASKATGFPIAKIAAKLALGYRLDEIPNDITRLTPASFEPTIDYVVVKVPRWAFEKFPRADRTLTTQMKSVGEVMAIGRTFKEAFMKAFRSLELGSTGSLIGQPGTRPTDDPASAEEEGALQRELSIPNDRRMWAIFRALDRGWSVDQLHELTKIDPWFLTQFSQIVELCRSAGLVGLRGMSPDLLRTLKRAGLSDADLGTILGTDDEAVRAMRAENGLVTAYKRIDTCAAEFESFTPYLYGTYEKECEADPTTRRKVVILGSGPNRIGQGLEFDYCCCHAAFALRDEGYETVMINCNPETVSTDYDTVDRLYFEPLTFEDVSAIIAREEQGGGEVSCVVQYRRADTPQTVASAAGGRDSHHRHISGLDRFGRRPRAVRPAPLGFGDSAGAERHGDECSGSTRGRREDRVSARRASVVRARWPRHGNRLRHLRAGSVYDRRSRRVAGPPHPHRQIPRGRVRARRRRRRRYDGGGRHRRDHGAHRGGGDSLRRQLVRRAAVPGRAAPRRADSRLHAAHRAGAESGRVDERAIRHQGRYGVRARGQSAGVADGPISVEGDRGAARQGRRARDDRPHSCRAGTDRRSRGRRRVRQDSGLPVRSVPWRRYDSRSGDEIDRRSDGRRDDVWQRVRESANRRWREAAVFGSAFISVNNYDKPGVVPIARDLKAAGFRLIATRGTANFLRAHGLEAEIVFKVNEGRPHVGDEILNNHVQLVINTPLGRESFFDDRTVRRIAMMHGVPCITTLTGAAAAVNAIRAMHTEGLTVRALQEYHAETATRKA